MIKDASSDSLTAWKMQPWDPFLKKMSPVRDVGAAKSNPGCVQKPHKVILKLGLCEVRKGPGCWLDMDCIIGWVREDPGLLLRSGGIGIIRNIQVSLREEPCSRKE